MVRRFGVEGEPRDEDNRVRKAREHELAPDGVASSVHPSMSRSRVAISWLVNVPMRASILLSGVRNHPGALSSNGVRIVNSVQFDSAVIQLKH